MNHDVNLNEKLKQYFGFDKFKGNQEAIIRNLLDGKNTFVLMPTGGGKSLCYQLPSLIMDGTAIVISPLIALMKNQVDVINGMTEADGVAHYLNSSLNKSAIDRVKADILEGKTKLLYVAPESLTKEDNVDFLRGVKISFYAVDEAHCISEWGHDFRPEYRRIRPIINEIGNAPVIALTATATDKVRTDIKKSLGILDAVVHHLDKVAGTIGADVGHARFAVHLGGDGLKNRAQGLPGFRSATRHQRRAVERAFLTTGHTATHEVEALSTYFLLTLDGVLEEGVATVDDDVARFEHLFQLRDGRVGRSTGLDHDDGGTRTLQGRGEFLERFGRHEVAFGAMLVHKLLSTRVVTVEQRHRVAMVCQITRQIGAHRGQSNHTNVCCLSLIHISEPTRPY